MVALSHIWSADSLIVQSFSRSSVILNLSELPSPGGFPATFRLSVVPRPWSIIMSNTVKLFLNGSQVRHNFREELDIPYRECVVSGDITWLWGGRRHCGCWRVWTSHLMTWLLRAAEGGCTQRVWLILPWSLCCSWLKMSDKHTEGLLDTNSFHMLPPSGTGGQWCNCLTLSWFCESLNNVKVTHLIPVNLELKCICVNVDVGQIT